MIVRTQFGSGQQFYDPSLWIDDGSLITSEDGDEISFEDLEDGAVKIAMAGHMQFHMPDPLIRLTGRCTMTLG